MFYIVYKIINQINGKFYIGSHKTKDLNDNYMGSGKYLIAAQKKYGLENFKKEILFIFDNPKDMYDKEAEIVNENFLVEENTYNLKLGGFGGWDYVNELLDKELIKNRNVKAAKNGSEKLSQTLRKNWDSGMYDHRRYLGVTEKFTQSSKTSFLGKKHTEETKKKIGEKNSTNQAGCKNSQYGTRWIHNLEMKVSRKIPNKDPLPSGWSEGRKIKF